MTKRKRPAPVVTFGCCGQTFVGSAAYEAHLAGGCRKLRTFVATHTSVPQGCLLVEGIDTPCVRGTPFCRENHPKIDKK